MDRDQQCLVVRTVICCPCCEGRGVVEPGAPTKLTPMQREIYLAVRAAKDGISMRRLSDRVYEDQIDGGPDGCFVAIRAQVYSLNKRLAPFGERVRSEAGVFRLFRTS